MSYYISKQKMENFCIENSKTLNKVIEENT